MRALKKRPLSMAHRQQPTTERLEQDITDLEIDNIIQEQNITDLEIAVMELQAKEE